LLSKANLSQENWDHIVEIAGSIDEMQPAIIAGKAYNDDAIWEFAFARNIMIYAYLHPRNKCFIATIGTDCNNYGIGDGLLALGPIMMSNFAVSLQYLSMMQAQNPPYMTGAGVHIQDPKGESDAVSAEPGAINQISPGSTSIGSAPLDTLIQPITVPHNNLALYSQVHQEEYLNIERSYKSSLLSMEAQQANETATAAAARISQSLRNFKSRAANYYQRLLFPTLTEVLVSQYREQMEGAQMQILALLYQLGIKVRLNYSKPMPNWAKDNPEIVAGEGELGVDVQSLLPSIDIESYSDEAERQMKILELQQEMQVRGMLAQSKEGLTEESANSITEKLDKLFS
jgi:hypothetical protein